jgi:hypothetical protein
MLKAGGQHKREIVVVSSSINELRKTEASEYRTKF